MGDSPSEISLKEYVDLQVESAKKAIVACRVREREIFENLRGIFEARIDSIEKATKLAADTMDKRLDGMNEFRDTLRDQASKFSTRAEIDLFKAGVEDDIRILRESKANLEGKASQNSVNLALAFSICGLLIGIFGIIMKFL